jgi:hypothetical protein
MKQIGMFTSMFPGGKTQSEEFREAAEKDKHRKHIVNAAGKGDEKKLQLLLTKYSGIDLNEKVPACPPIHHNSSIVVPTSLRFTQKPYFYSGTQTNHLVVPADQCTLQPASFLAFFFDL